MTNYNNRETLCRNCSHQEVCSFKDEFLNAREAVNNVSVQRPSDGDEICYIQLCDIPWIKPVGLVCSHYIAKPNNNIRTGE